MQCKKYYKELNESIDELLEGRPDTAELCKFCPCTNFDSKKVGTNHFDCVGVAGVRRRLAIT